MTRVRHLKKGDLVKALSGSFKNESPAKVLDVNHTKGMVKVEGMGVVKRHVRPTQQNPKGGIEEKNRWMPACIFQVCSTAGKPLGRTGFEAGEKGEKKRVYSSSRKKH